MTTASESYRDSSQPQRHVVDKTHGLDSAGEAESATGGTAVCASSGELTVWYAETSDVTTESASSSRLGGESERRALRRFETTPAITKRSLAIGILLVIFVAAFTPYNDYILQNTYFIGNHLPIGIVTLMAALVLLVNPLLSLFGRDRLSTGELVVIMTFMLVGASAPSSGLMRYLEPMVVSPFYLAREWSWLKDIANLLPSWLVPSKDPASSTVLNYWQGVSPGELVPVRAFLVPQVLWAILIGAIFGSALFLSAIFRKQWVHHERLTFPLATIPLELMAAPEPGRWYNKLWRNPLLWTGIAIPVFVYLLSGLNHTKLLGVPDIALKYDFTAAFTERPWDAMPFYIRSATLYFSVVGVCFFVPSEIAFSLWFFLVINGLARVMFARWGVDPGQHEATRAIGTYVGYFAGLVWLARGHLKHVIVSAWNKAPRDEAEPLSYRTMTLGWLVCNVVAWCWLMAAGVNPFLALVVLGVGTMLVTLMARIVAESGLFFVGSMWQVHQFVGLLIGPKLVSHVNFFWTQVISRVFYADLRETLMPFAANSMRMSSEIRTDQRPRWFRWLFIVLFISVLVSGGVHHYLSYTRGQNAMMPIVDYSARQQPQFALEETYRFWKTAPETTVGQSWTQVGIGGVMVVALIVGRIMWVWWPFHPIGLVLMNAGPMQQFWFAIFVGWVIKRLLLRYGGASAFRRARPFFIGLIMGEVLAAGLWMIVGVISQGAASYSILPR